MVQPLVIEAFNYVNHVCALGSVCRRDTIFRCVYIDQKQRPLIYSQKNGIVVPPTGVTSVVNWALAQLL